MTAQEAYMEYGSQYAIYQLPNDLIQLRNSAGHRMTVHRNTKVYHRGNGRFAKYSEIRDLRYNKARKQTGWNHDGNKPPVGARRHQGDTRRSKLGGYV